MALQRTLTVRGFSRRNSMKKRFNLKAKLAELLAAVMVFSMAAPGIPAYAVNYGETSVIEFDPQAGPGLLHSSYSGVPRRADGVSFATGQAGHPLTDSADFNGIPREDFGSGQRPQIPEFNVAWDGYTFDGWVRPYSFTYMREAWDR